MANTVTVNTSYVGEEAGGYIHKALLAGNTLASGMIDFHPEIVTKEFVEVMEVSNMVHDATCDFTADGTTAISERVLEPKELQVNHTICKDKFLSTWKAKQMGASARNGRKVPKEAGDYLRQLIMLFIAQSTEQSIWTGDKTVDGEFDGFSTLIALDANLPAAQEIAGTAAISAAATVIDELGKLVDAIPDRLYDRDDLAMYITPGTYKAYNRALGGFGVLKNVAGSENVSDKGANGYMGQGPVGRKPLDFEGIPLVICNGLGANTAMLSYKENLWFGFGEESDKNEIQTIDMAQITGSKNIRLIGRYTAGAQYGFAEDIVTYGITNSAN